MAAYYHNRRMPLRPACGLHEDEPVIHQSKLQKEVPSFPLSVFPTAIRNIVEALVEYEHFNVNFIAASMFTTFAAAMGNRWTVRFSATWVERPIMYVALVGYPSCGTLCLATSVHRMPSTSDEHSACRSQRFLRNTALFRKEEHGRYTKMSCDP